jgi:hypothetical protein
MYNLIYGMLSIVFVVITGIILAYYIGKSREAFIELGEAIKEYNEAKQKLKDLIK